MKTISELMADPTQHFVWVADEPLRKEHEDDLHTWRAHCSCGWAGSEGATEDDADEQAVAHKAATE